MQVLVKNLSLLIFAGVAFNIGYFFYFDFHLIRYLTYTDHLLSISSLGGMAFIIFSVLTDLDHIAEPKRYLTPKSAIVLSLTSLAGLLFVWWFQPKLLSLSAIGIYFLGSDIARYALFYSKEFRLEILFFTTLFAISIYGYSEAIAASEEKPIKICGEECSNAVRVFVGEAFSIFISSGSLVVVPTAEIRLIDYGDIVK